MSLAPLTLLFLFVISHNAAKADIWTWTEANEIPKDAPDPVQVHNITLVYDSRKFRK